MKRGSWLLSNLWVAGVLATTTAACGNSASLGKNDAGTDVTDTDSPTAGDGPSCAGTAPVDCEPGAPGMNCSDSAFTPSARVCEQGSWICPSGYTPSATCGCHVAGAPGGPCPEGDGGPDVIPTCGPGTPSGPEVSIALGDPAAPLAQGGTITEGSYELTSARQWGVPLGADAGTSGWHAPFEATATDATNSTRYRQTLQIAGNRFGWALTRDGVSAGSDVPVFSAAGTTLTFSTDDLCPGSTGDTPLEYTATSTELTLYVTRSLFFTYTRR